MHSWLTAEKTYEGAPLLLRRPADFDIASLRPGFPTLVVITHQFTRRMPNGLPDPDYNDGLAEMDHEVVTAFDADQMGVAALVETCAGKRTYYIYVTADADVSNALSAVARRYPDERLSWSFRSDPEWTFIQRYAKDHF
jgi:uncharacterized protein DUF695